MRLTATAQFGLHLDYRARRALVWSLRHERGWDLARIGSSLGVKTAAVSRLLQREAAVRTAERASVVELHEPPRRRAFRPLSLSLAINA